MKGQFFIISTVIMISALILITNYLYDYGATDLTSIEQMQELNYISDIQNNIRSTAEISCYAGSDELLVKNLDLISENLKKSLLEKGIQFSMITLPISPSCTSETYAKFIIKSSEFEIESNFLI